jgi:hypothetical protein
MGGRDIEAVSHGHGVAHDLLVDENCSEKVRRTSESELAEIPFSCSLLRGSFV